MNPTQNEYAFTNGIFTVIIVFNLADYPQVSIKKNPVITDATIVTFIPPSNKIDVTNGIYTVSIDFKSTNYPQISIIENPLPIHSTVSSDPIQSTISSDLTHSTVSSDPIQSTVSSDLIQYNELPHCIDPTDWIIKYAESVENTTQKPIEDVSKEQKEEEPVKIVSKKRKEKEIEKEIEEIEGPETQIQKTTILPQISEKEAFEIFLRIIKGVIFNRQSQIKDLIIEVKKGNSISDLLLIIKIDDILIPYLEKIQKYYLTRDFRFQIVDYMRSIINESYILFIRFHHQGDVSFKLIFSKHNNSIY